MFLKFDQVSRSYSVDGKEVPVLRECSFSVTAGEFVAVMGQSGCGKSTLLLTAGGLLTPQAGIVTVNDQHVYALPPRERAAFRAATIGFVFQQFHLVPYLTVMQNVLSPVLANPTHDATARAEQLISQFGLQDRSHHTPNQLSVGERQRTALARALLHHPSLILADEPTGNLDHENSEFVLQHLKDYTAQGGTVLLVTHDETAARFADRTVRLQNGQITKTELEPATTGESSVS